MTVTKIRLPWEAYVYVYIYTQGIHVGMYVYYLLPESHRLFEQVEALSAKKLINIQNPARHGYAHM